MSPTFMVGADGETVTLATAIGTTVTVAFADLPSADAVIVTVPEANAETSPEVVTAAFVASDVDQTIVRPAIIAPEASSSEAVNCWVPPTITEAAVGATVTDARTGEGAVDRSPLPPHEMIIARSRTRQSRDKSTDLPRAGDKFNLRRASDFASGPPATCWFATTSRATFVLITSLLLGRIPKELAMRLR